MVTAVAIKDPYVGSPTVTYTYTALTYGKHRIP
jgi:hypothetical protein